jgi:hypothetical protein
MACGHSYKIGLSAAGAAIDLVHDLGKYSSAFQQYLRRVALDKDTNNPTRNEKKPDQATGEAYKGS